MEYYDIGTLCRSEADLRVTIKRILDRILNSLPPDPDRAAALAGLAGNNGLMLGFNDVTQATRAVADLLLVGVRPGCETQSQRILRYHQSLQPPYGDPFRERWTPNGRHVLDHPIRNLRLLRASTEVVESLRTEYGEEFNYTHMTGEVLGVAEVDGVRVWLFLSLYPFFPLYLVAVPELYRRHPQTVTPRFLRLMQVMYEQLKDAFPGIVLAVNSYGGGASVKQFHFHVMLDARGLSLERGVGRAGIEFRQFSTAPDAWPAIEELHDLNTRAYSLLLGPTAQLLPRAFQQPLPPGCWYTPPAFGEAGGLYVPVPGTLPSWSDLTDDHLDDAMWSFVTGKRTAAAAV